MKKTLILFITILFLVSGCARIQNDETVHHIEIIKQLDHASLDEIAKAIESRLIEEAKSKNIPISINISSGQNDPTILKQLSDQAVSTGADVIIPIATLAAQIAVSSCANTKTPIVYAAVSDPEGADLTGFDYVTGTSDALNTQTIISMILAQNPNLKKVGLLYSLSETNSFKPISEAKQILDEKGIEYVEAVGNTTDEILTSTSVLLFENVEAVFTPTDNVVMAAELALAPMLLEANIPHYTGADSFVRNGAYATCGVNYTKLGFNTADLALKVITEGFENIDDYYLMDGGIITINNQADEILNLDLDVLKQFGEIVKVDTSED